MQNYVAALKQVLQHLDKLIFNRENILKQIKEGINAVRRRRAISSDKLQDSILEKIIQIPEYEFDAVFTRELHKHGKRVAELKETFGPQGPLLEKIKVHALKRSSFFQDEYRKVSEQQQNNPNLAQRQKVMQEFEVAFSNYSQIADHISCVSP